MSFYTSLSGLKSAQTEMSTISHNLANVSTNGFKKSRVEFGDIIASSVSMSPTQMVGSGTVVKAIRQQFAQGGLLQSTSSEPTDTEFKNVLESTTLTKSISFRTSSCCLELRILFIM